MTSISCGWVSWLINNFRQPNSCSRSWMRSNNDSDVGDKLSMTTVCWRFYIADRLKLLVTESLCWQLVSLCWWFFQCIQSVTNVLNLSPTHFVFDIRNQHRCHRTNLPSLDTNHNFGPKYEVNSPPWTWVKFMTKTFLCVT